MPVHIEKLKGIAFLAFPEALEFLKSELKNRFSLPEETKFKCYGDLIYFDDLSILYNDEFIVAKEIPAEKLPYWATQLVKLLVLSRKCNEIGLRININILDARH